jgi:pyruvate dehydrogenase E1 component beta subunit
MRQISYRQAVLEALTEEMERDERVVLIGEDVGAAGGVFGQTRGLYERFGARRVIDTPISESAIVGLTVGAAMAGLRPVVEIMFGDFITLGMDQLVNQAAKIHWMSNGQFRVPLVLRTSVGTGSSTGPQHSQALHAWCAHVPGLKVVFPSAAADAKALLKAAVRDDNPVVFFEDRASYAVKGPVPEGDLIAPLGRAAVVRRGRDISLIAVGRCVGIALAAADLLRRDNVEAEVLDVRTLSPLDVSGLADSVRRTSRALVLDQGTRRGGLAAEIAQTLSEQVFDWLDAPVERLAAADHPVPFAPALEQAVLPGAREVRSHVLRMLGRKETP